VGRITISFTSTSAGSEIAKATALGAYTSGTNHFAHAGKPKDEARIKEYEAGPTAAPAKEILDGFARAAVPDADVSEVAKAIGDVVDMSFEKWATLKLWARIPNDAGQKSHSRT
jgi:hypothetical protein